MDVELTLEAFRKARMGNEVHVASTGEEALGYLFGSGKFEDRKVYPIPDIVLLDLKLPGIDGLDVLRQVKQAERLKRIPVIILTSSKEEGDRALSYDLGANSYLVKPVSFEGFMEVVRQIGDYWLVLNVAASPDA